MPDIFGTAASEGLTGTSGSDTIFGGGGNDYIAAGAGSDRLVGGSGADYMEGGSGSDTFVWFGANDLVKYGAPGGRLDVVADFTGGGVNGGDDLIFYGFGKGGQLVFNSNSFNGTTEDATKQYYDVIDSSGTYQGSIFVLMADGYTGKLVAGVDYFFGN